MTNNALVVGASGAIGSSLVTQLAHESYEVYAVSRNGHSDPQWPNNVHVFRMPVQDEPHMEAFKAQMRDKNIRFSKVFITTGVLHDDAKQLLPEKRLEDVSSLALSEYFSVNSIVPMLWLKLMVSLVDNDATLVCLSARVGSISDNKLGGWYGYRASKAALNMYIKTASVEYQRRTKGAVFVSYHPGTVDSELSAPFQKNVQAKKLFTPTYTTQQLLHHITHLDREKVVHFIDWQGKTIDW